MKTGTTGTHKDSSWEHADALARLEEPRIMSLEGSQAEKPWYRHCDGDAFRMAHSFERGGRHDGVWSRRSSGHQAKVHRMCKRESGGSKACAANQRGLRTQVQGTNRQERSLPP